jgi:NagD protein
MHTVLVLTGSTTREIAERFPYRPSRIVDSIADLVDELDAADAPSGTWGPREGG